MITTLTPQHQVALANKASEWIVTAFRTNPIEGDKIIPAIQDLYNIAKLKTPRVVMVASPLLMIYTQAIAATLLDKHRIKSASITQPNDHQVHTTIEQAVRATIEGLVPQKVIDGLTSGLTPREACLAWAGKSGLKSVSQWSDHTQPGNANPSWMSYIAAYRDVLNLDIPELQLVEPYERCTKEGSFRSMHEDFCIVSDFPKSIMINANNQAHNATGPTHVWRDGWELYHWNGVAVPKSWITDSASLTIDEVCNHPTAARAGLEIMGWDGVFNDNNTTLLDRDEEFGELYEVAAFEGVDMSRLFLKTSTGWMEVDDDLRSATGGEITKAFDAASALALAKLK